MNIINNIVAYSTEIISNGGILFGMLIIIIESFIPALPLCVFIALNINAFGMLLGTIISWLSTCIGCYLSYLIFYHLSNNLIYRHLSKKTKNKIDKSSTTFRNISLSNLVIIMTLPFTPAFLINILAGITSMSKKKFVAALLIGKIFMVIFWGYVGKSLIESVTDLKTIIIILIMVLLAYIISKIVSKKSNIE